jgi:hypothetical protein
VRPPQVRLTLPMANMARSKKRKTPSTYTKSPKTIRPIPIATHSLVFTQYQLVSLHLESS